MILTDSNIVAFIGNIETGIYPEADGSRELYKITNDDGVFYAVTEGFTLHNVEVPSEVEPIKWCYTEADGFYANPTYHEPEPNPMDRIEAQVMFTALMTDTSIEGE